VEGIFSKLIFNFFAEFISSTIRMFSTILADLSATAINILSMEIVKRGISYAQSLAMVLLIIKSMYEAFQTYIMHQSGDPDADPIGLVIRTGQAVAVIMCLPWIVQQMYTFGSKVAHDITTAVTEGPSSYDINTFSDSVIASYDFSLLLLLLVFIVLLIIISLQVSIRGAELALLSVIGPILALNITANNRSMWSSWFRQLVAICLTQALQMFLFTGGLMLFFANPISGKVFLWGFGWLWVTIKCPKFIQQFVHSTGIGSAVGGTVKQAGTYVIMRKIMMK